jgi:hypothetical protein
VQYEYVADGTESQLGLRRTVPRGFRAYELPELLMTMDPAENDALPFEGAGGSIPAEQLLGLH